MNLVKKYRDLSANLSIQVIGYPKTGNTWFRFLVGRYLQSLAHADELILLEGTAEEAALLDTIGCPPIAVTHGNLTWNTQTTADLTEANSVGPYILNAQVVLICRHPLDALLSHYMHNKNQAGAEARTQYESFDAFINSPVHGLEKFCRYYSLWAEALRSGQAFLARYEDLKRDPLSTVTAVLNYLSLPVEPVCLKEAVEYASFDNMKRMEASNAPSFKSSGFRVFATGDKNNPDAFHVRRGLVGGYREHLTQSQIVHYTQFIHERLPKIFRY
jgi:alcohol sulfotransferase